MIIAVVGPTGIGKTKLSIMLAKKYNAIVLNCDAMQVYKEMNIGTAKVTAEEKEGIEHLLFDLVSVTEEYSVYDYQKDLREVLAKHKNRNIIIVGGTGLYLKAGLFNYEFSEMEEKNEYEDFSNEELYLNVKKLYPDVEVHVNNRRRLISVLNRKGKNIKSDKLLYDVKFIGLNLERDKLYELVNKRVDIMFENNLLTEVEDLYNQGLRTKSIMTSIGYKELYKYFDNEISLLEAKELIKKNTRNYVKRQYTWYNNQLNVKWFDVNLNNFNETYENVINYIETLDNN